MGTDDTNMGWNCTVTDNHVQSCMKPTATWLSPQGTKQHVSKFTLGTNSPSPPPTLKGLIYVRMEMVLNMVFKLIFTDLETRLYIV